MISAAARTTLAAFVAILVGVAAPQSELVLVKERTKEYHRPSCPVVRDGKGVVALTKAQADKRGFTSHDACDPATAPPSASSEDKRVQPSPVFVYTDGGKYYHKQDCEKLGKDAKRVDLEQAGKEHWPCPTCRPPIRQRKVR